MSLRMGLEPLTGLDDLVALLVLTVDGLPVEMLGYGMRAERLAAEMASVAESARRGTFALGLGPPSRQRIITDAHTIDLFPVEGHYLVVISAGQSEELPPGLLDSTLSSLGRTLRGEQ